MSADPQSTTLERLARILANEIQLPLEAAHNPDLSIASTGLTSLNLVRVLIAIENEFQIEFPDADLDLTNFGTMGALARFIETRMSTP